MDSSSGNPTDNARAGVGIDPTLALGASDAIIEISADAIISIDEAHRIIRFNNGAQEIFGYRPDEIIGQEIGMLIPARFRARHPGQIENFARSPTAARRMGERRQISGLRKGGREFPAEASISKTRVGDQWIFTVTLRDVTDRIRAQQAQSFLAQATAVLNGSLDAESTIASATTLALPTLGDWCILFLRDNSGVMRRARAVHRDPARDPDMAALVNSSFTPREDHPLWPCIQDGVAMMVPDITEEMLGVFAASGSGNGVFFSLRPASVIAVPLTARTGRTGAIAFFLDATSGRRHDQEDLHLAEELARRAGMALENAQLYAIARNAITARDDVLAVVSHDLGNPLAAIRLSTTVIARLLARDPEPHEGFTQQVDNIRASVDQMGRLIKDLLDVKRIDAGFLGLDTDRVSVAGLMHEVFESFHDIAEARGILLVVDPPADDIQVVADHARITQVLSNLVGNALKFTSSGQRVTVSARCLESAAQISVADNGPGIPADHLPHIFDRFWQARRTGRDSIGLGLAIVKGIIDAHNGTVSVESELGSGTTFTFTLPVDR